MAQYKTFFSCTLHYDLSVNGDLLWTLFKRGDVSSSWNLLSATKYHIFYLRSFFAFTNSAYPDEMPHDGISPVCRCKEHVDKKYISQLKCSRISSLKLFLVPYMYAFTGCNLRVSEFDVSAPNMIIFGVNISSSSG